jgi:hypothetical protein
MIGDYSTELNGEVRFFAALRRTTPGIVLLSAAKNLTSPLENQQKKTVTKASWNRVQFYLLALHRLCRQFLSPPGPSYLHAEEAEHGEEDRNEGGMHERR